MLEEENKTTKEDFSSPWRMTDEEIMLERMRNIEEGKQMWASMEKELEEYEKRGKEDKEKIRELKERVAALEK